MRYLSKGRAVQCLATAKALRCAVLSRSGGRGGVLNDRKLCALTPGCDRSKWFCNVETVSGKSRIAVGGCRQSYYQINRECVR